MCVRARVRSVWRVEVWRILKSAIFRMFASSTAVNGGPSAVAGLEENRRGERIGGDTVGVVFLQLPELGDRR